MKKLILFLCLCCSSLFTSTPITHAYLANLWVKANGEKLDTQFLLGSLYPDIRYVANIPRRNTHDTNVTKKDITGAQTRFLSGCKLHSFTDEARNKFVTESKIYAWLEKKCKNNPILHTIFKSHKYHLLCILEDEIIREAFSADGLTKYFGKIHSEEITDNITEKNVETWHHFLNAYFTGQIPAGEEIPAKLMPLFFVRSFVVELKHEATAVLYTHKMITYFKKLFTQENGQTKQKSSIRAA